jgi:hypothetical protein
VAVAARGFDGLPFLGCLEPLLVVRSAVGPVDQELIFRRVVRGRDLLGSLYVFSEGLLLLQGSQKGEDEHKLISQKAFDHGFAFHTGFGYFIFLGALILLVLALAARLGKRRVLWALAVPVAVAVQIVLAWISESTHGVGVLHGINALVLFGLTGYLTDEAWRGTRAPVAPAQPTPGV